MAIKRERVAVFHPEFREDLRFLETNRRVALRALDIVDAVLRDPFAGIGKPEPLKYLASGTWSRRLTTSGSTSFKRAITTEGNRA